ncbi:MAG: YeeE/YedE family protein [Alphaproteobacteria bacterium]
MNESPVVPAPRLAGALAIATAVATVAWWLSGRPGEGPAFAFSWLAGAAFGFVIQRSRFCFLCILRDWVAARDPRGLLAILAALAVGTVGYMAVYGAWLPDPFAGRLPPDAHIGAVGWPLAVAAAVFGLGMALSGACISAHLYRLGEGWPLAPFGLLGTVAGFVLGFVTWPFMWTHGVRDAPVLWLPGLVGYGPTLLALLALFGGLAVLLLRLGRRPVDVPVPPPSGLAQAVLGGRWPAWVGGLLVGMIGTVAYLRVGPLGVTAELGSAGRMLAADAGLIADRLDGLDTLRGCIAAVRETVLSENGCFIFGLVAGALAGGIGGGQFRPRRPDGTEVARSLAGGVLLGWGAMTALGCTVGVLLSGTMAGAVSGLVFAVCCLAGCWAGLRFLPARWGGADRA